MATQLSAVTMIGTTGQGATDGMRFIQFYFGLPLAMVILGVTLVPFLHGAKVYTAYEYLERRFDAKTRSLTAFLFLISRGMSCGAIIAAPAVVFSAIFGWEHRLVGRADRRPDGALHDDRRRAGGHVGRRQADGAHRGGARRDRDHAARADPGYARRRAARRRRRRTAARVRLLVHPHADRTRSGPASSAARSSCCRTSAPTRARCSAISRAKSVDEARSSLLMSAYWKIPLQALILLVGVLVFVFYQFQPAPLLYNPAHERARARRAGAVRALEQLRASCRSATAPQRSMRARGYRRDARRSRVTRAASTPCDRGAGARGDGHRRAVDAT